jgi:hypothetical protein
MGRWQASLDHHRTWRPPLETMTFDQVGDIADFSLQK